jgi:hypothetical protein
VLFFLTKGSHIMTFNYKLISLALLSSLAMGIEAGKKTAKSISQRTAAPAAVESKCPSESQPTCPGECPVEGDCCSSEPCCDNGFDCYTTVTWCISPYHRIDPTSGLAITVPSYLQFAKGQVQLCFSEDLSRVAYTVCIFGLNTFDFPNLAVAGAWFYDTRGQDALAGAGSVLFQPSFGTVFGEPIVSIAGLNGFGNETTCTPIVSPCCIPFSREAGVGDPFFPVITYSGTLTNDNLKASSNVGTNLSCVQTVATFYHATTAGHVGFALIGSDACAGANAVGDQADKYGIDFGGIMRGNPCVNATISSYACTL